MIKQVLKNLDETLVQRGKDYDKKGYERSMPQVVEVFNSLTGHKLTVKQGWEFMLILKLVRAQSNPSKIDTYIDLAGYAVLLNEQAMIDAANK